jgi:regulator of protease activity HflC (stomatin/prohibitin superfamily)
MIYLLPVVLALFLLSVVTIRQGMIGVTTIFGKYRRILSPGFNFRIPFFEVIFKKISIQNRSAELGFQAVTLDQANVNFTALVVYAVINHDEETIKNVAFKFIDERSFMQALVRTIEGNVRSFVATKKQSEILTLRNEIVHYVKENSG